MQTRLHSTRTLTRTLLATAGALALAATAHAVTPGKFTQTTEADFADGDAYGTVVTNLGDIKLSSDTTELEGLPEDVTVIHDVVTMSNGKMYVATGPEAKILELDGDSVKLVAEFPGEQVFTLYTLGAQLVMGVSSFDSSRLVELKDGKPVTLAEFAEAGYIWDIAELDRATKSTDDDQYVVATGTPGKIYTVSKQGGEPTLLFECKQSNILSLATVYQRAPIYAGTDTDGLIYRIDSDGSPFVVYDAPEAEVSTLVAMPDGTVYAGTAAAEQARPGRLEQPEKVEEGRPDVEPIDLDKPEPQPLAQPEVPAEVVEPAAPDEAQQPAEDAEGEADAADDEPAGKPTPTKEQYDELREALKERLEAARESGQFDAATDGAAPANNNANNNAKPARPSRAKPAAPAQTKKGNAIYRIAPDGFVAEVFRESAMILSIVPHDEKLIVATGNEGQVFSVDPTRGETTVLADLDSSQITCATPTDKGLLLGGANPGALLRMELAVADEGGYTSKVLDAGQVSIFGTFKLTADIPANTTVVVELRSGNVGDPEQAAWSKWSEAVTIDHNADANPLQPREIKIEVPPARYLQYRLSLKGDGESTPVVDQADLAYVAPNTPPTVAKLIVKPANKPAPGTDPDPKLQVQWQATDANKDRLVYSLEYKPGKADRYLPLAEDLTAPKYDWMTQHVPDGWYTLRVTAHDKLDNPPTSAKTGGRVSEPILIDNSDPALDGLKAEILGNGKVKLAATAEDELSAIQSVAYSIDGADQYQASLPADLIYDSTSEPWGVTISDLSPGGHVISVRVIDAKGNTAYRQLIVDVE